MIKYKNCIAVIGDIHGCLKQLTDIYKTISEFNIPVYSVGDFIDRGKHSKDVVSFLIDKNIKAVLGNHEAWFLNAMKTEEGITAFKDWVSVGGGLTVLSYFNDVKDVTIKGYKDIMTENGHLDFISSLPLKIEINNVFISHAGKIKDGNDNTLYFNYGKPEKLEGKLQVFGHKPNKEIDYVKGWYVNTDTGCVFGNKLTAVIIDTITAEIVKTVEVTYTD